jgi:hypothetical protein
MITYSARKVSLYDAVMAVATLAQYHAGIAPGWIEVSALPPVIITKREYLLPPNAFRVTPADPSPTFSWKIPSKPRYELLGQDHAPGATAALFLKTMRLLVIASEADHQKLQAQSEASWREYYAGAKKPR